MKKFITTLFLTALCAGCAGFPYGGEMQPLQSANKIIEKPIVIKPPADKLKVNFMAGNNPELEKAYNRYLKTGRADNIVSQGFVQFAYNSHQQPIVATNPLTKTVISLEPGEKYTNITSSDPAHWTYQVAYSGSNATKQLHIILQPALPNLSANLVIATNKRLYNLKIVSVSDDTFVKDVSFWYPDAMTEAWNQYNEEELKQLNQPNSLASITNLTDLNFDYVISSSWLAPRWKPLNVFDNKTHVYIQFPDQMVSDEMPALFVVNGKTQELVNYRVNGHYFIVDKLFQKAVLISGVGAAQKRVVITNPHYH